MPCTLPSNLILKAQKRIQIFKSGGDDRYSWALFIDGRMVYNGMDRQEASSRRKRAINELVEKWVAGA